MSIHLVWTPWQLYQFCNSLGNFRSFNVDVLLDAATWLGKLKNRPLSDKE